ncbi:glycoside hydrolase family 5 protein [Botryobasidium botryosum FD-172 SS1]|uniref:glucan 1,3-beta-glucosidase n=1 Tax=Botryobasidium botryosum (strain FD-172 SS1) TaxID=930990 RepID=A0A067MKR9_BOTB1|nr:glycoside hydrolase family 5 protein [Botryobasidium botryosum FD-172 SS1]
MATGKKILIGVAAVAVAVIAAVVPVYFLVIKPHQQNNNAATSGSGGSGTSAGGGGSPGVVPPKNGAVTGGDGSLITTETGSTFTYTNKLGGFWVFDPANPFNNSAAPQSYTKPLSQQWQYGVDTIRGFNLGGWLIIEPFISPSLFEPYTSGASPPVDEWTLSLAMAADTANGGLAKIMENHYDTFITEEDFALIAGAGLNWVRIPIPFWIIETRNNEPFLASVGWKYFLKAITWARKYGLRINLDLHALPGSQNAFNHSGRLGVLNFLNGVMGVANAQRSLDYIRILAEFISQPQYSSVVCMFSVVNEPVLATIGQAPMEHFILQAYNAIRTASGTGTGNGPFIAIHDGFLALTSWVDFLPGADRVALDTHQYLCFADQDPSPPATQATRPCAAWSALVTASLNTFGMTFAGEFSNGWCDCGKWLNGVNLGARYDATFVGGPTTAAGNCTTWTDYQSWTADTKAGIQQFAMTSMDALQHWFFWTWKIGNSSVSGKVESPLWSYQLGLQNGWMPADPRSASGLCASQGVTATFTGTLQPWQTGGASAGTLNAASSAAYSQWPPASLSSIANAAVLPTYTPTGTLITLAVPTFTKPGSKETIDAGTGWNNKADTQGMMVAVQGCTYPDAWNAQSVAVPVAACTGAAAGAAATRKRFDVPAPTATPQR